MQRAKRSAAVALQAVTDAETARRALARLEQATGAGALDSEAVAVLLGHIESGSRALVGVFRRLVQDLDVDDRSAEAPHLREASEQARELADTLRELRSVLDRNAHSPGQ